jgi:hypothetical protein
MGSAAPKKRSCLVWSTIVGKQQSLIVDGR